MQIHALFYGAKQAEKLPFTLPKQQSNRDIRMYPQVQLHRVHQSCVKGKAFLAITHKGLYFTIKGL